MITCYKALLSGHSLESQTALVLCDGYHLLFYLTHTHTGSLCKVMRFAVVYTGV